MATKASPSPPASISSAASPRTARIGPPNPSPADHLQATSCLGLSTWPFKTPLPRQQFRFEPDPSKARYAVIADIDQRWTLAQPNVSKLVERFEKEKWPVVWAGEYYFVLKNPRIAE